MSGDRYPILVERLASKQALLIVCVSCRAEAYVNAEDIRNDENYGCAGCGASAVYKYAEADDKCPNCGKLGFFSPVLEHCCSRVCQLQAEYARTLSARRAAAA